MIDTSVYRPRPDRMTAMDIAPQIQATYASRPVEPLQIERS